MRFLSVCSGIEAASTAWRPLGWEAVAFSEIEPFPCAVLAHHYPDVPNWGDMTKFQEWPDVSIDLLCGGTPCQSFSVAGLRKGLADPRGNLMLTFGAIAAKYRPRWLVWENVPGVLSSNGGRDFGSFLGMLGQLGYGFAYRVLDAQYVRVESHPRAVPQRRRRVFVVGHLGDWRRAAAVLFERESLSGHPAPSRKAREGFAACTAPSLTASGRGVERCGESREQDPVIAVADVAPTLDAHYGDSHDLEYRADGSANAVLTPNGGRGGIGVGAIAFGWQNSASQGASASEHHSPTLDKSKTPAVAQGMQVRRLTPLETERLQGFPDGYTAVPFRGKPASDGPRYKSHGNSWAINCPRWIGERIESVEAICAEQERLAA
jgi:DNA (cytosine-5)-methyltransferase 1